MALYFKIKIITLSLLMIWYNLVNSKETCEQNITSLEIRVAYRGKFSIPN